MTDNSELGRKQQGERYEFTMFKFQKPNKVPKGRRSNLAAAPPLLRAVSAEIAGTCILIQLVYDLWFSFLISREQQPAISFNMSHDVRI